jgi:hypothetical protein
MPSSRRSLPLILAAALISISPAVSSVPNASSWPTLHGDLARSGFYPSFPRPPLKLAWRKELWRELTGTRSEVIVGDGLAFMGTYAGKMYALDAATGAERWVFPTEGPIGHSPAWDAGVLYFGSMDGRVYAVESVTGKLRWQFRAPEGFWTSPAVANGRVLLGCRDGVFYALRANSGKVAWSLRTEAPIISPASVSGDGKVLFGSEDMRLYCADVATG